MVLPCWFRRRSGGWARTGAAGETRKTKFAKRTWNVSWNQQINFLVRSTDPVAEARTHRKKRDVCATRGWFGLRERTQPLGTKPECVLESIVSRSARLSRIGCVGEYLYGAPVLVPAALPWLGPDREGGKGPPLRACGGDKKNEIRKPNLKGLWNPSNQKTGSVRGGG